jgi:hypothetical protein
MPLKGLITILNLTKIGFILNLLQKLAVGGTKTNVFKIALPKNQPFYIFYMCQRRCLTERAMAWQDRATNALKTEEVSNALAKLSEHSHQPRYSMRFNADFRNDKNIDNFGII